MDSEKNDSLLISGHQALYCCTNEINGLSLRCIRLHKFVRILYLFFIICCIHGMYMLITLRKTIPYHDQNHRIFAVKFGLDLEFMADFFFKLSFLIENKCFMQLYCCKYVSLNIHTYVCMYVNII